MSKQLLEELVYISSSVGCPVEFTQGGGGNTSVKLSDEHMAVKASGFKLKQITCSDGYVIVDYKNIKDYYDHVDLSQERDFEKESTEFVKKNIIATENQTPLRPSVEAGFHSVLKKYVIHTHTVYANILCCTKNGADLVDRIFGDKGYAYVWIPYINPGFYLTLKIKEAVDQCLKKTAKFPQVIFMENHGLIVTSDDSKDCVGLHQEVNEAIREYLSIEDEFPRIEIAKIDDNTFLSKTQYLKDYFKRNKISEDFFDKTVLYPDQLVYLNGNVGVDTMQKKININSRSGEIIYKTTIFEAQTIEETLLAYVYVLTHIEKHGLELKTMSDKETDFIKNWESEAYRKSLAKNR